MKQFSRFLVRVCVMCVVGTAVAGSAAESAQLNVPAGGDLQVYLNNAQPGDVIVLPAGARFVGQFRFPAKAGMVTLRSSGTLPDRRVTPADAALMATIVSPTTMMSIDLYDSKNWTIDGVRFEPNSTGAGEIIGIQRGENIVLKRLLFVVPSTQQQKRFVLGNGRNITLTQSHCGGVWRTSQDSQCFAAWDGAGPYRITDNFLEAASENVMFGGADSISPDNLPSNILIENNLFTKRLEWKGQARGVKNLFELKAARGVTVRNNIFERNWIDAQSGSAIVFTPRNQDGNASWSAIEDVLFEYNIVRDTPSHFNILGYDDLEPSGQATRITIRHNLLLGTGGGRLLTAGNEVGALTFDHNTYVNPQPSESSMTTLYAEGSIVTTTGSRKPAFAVNQFTFTNNMTHGNAYGLHSSVGFGSAALTAMTRTPDWRNNVVAGGWGTYPVTTTLLAVASYLGNFDSSYYLVSTSPFKSVATDGTDLGWNRSSAPAPPPTCSYAVSPASVSFTQSASTATVDVVTSAGCSWTTQSGTGWVSVGPGRTGAGSVAVSVTSNTGASRAATVTIAGVAVSVSQAGTATVCSYDVSPIELSFPATGGSATVSVATTQGCTWSSSSGVNWLSVAGSANGPGTATVTSGINSGAARSATVTVAGRTVTVSQSAPDPSTCTYEVSPTSLSIASTGGTLTVQVTTAAGCPWTTKSNTGWMKVSSGDKGSGTVTLTVNSGGGARTATADIAGRTVTVNQQAGPKGRGLK